MDSSSSIINENDPDFDEKELTEKKVKLENGSYNYVFTNAIDDRHKEYWRCNVCDVVVGGSLSKHAMGKKHQANMALAAHPVYLWANAPVPKSTLGMKLAPGEPVPPGFEDEVRGVTEIQAVLDAYHNGPLIGLGYLIELAAVEEEREPQYVCLLCDKRGDPRTFMAHLTSFNHRMAYLVKHFPTVYRALTPYTKQYRRNVQNLVTAICEQIEKRFGRMIPQAAERETFERKKHIYLDGVIKDKHPSERMGETFEYLIDKDVLTAGPIDPIIEIKKTSEDQFKGRQYRKTGSVPGCKDLGNPSKRDPSPPIVAAPEIKKSATIKSERRSLSSISSISSSSLSSPRVSRSPSPRSNNRVVKRRYTENIPRRSRSRSRSAKRYYRRSRSYSRSPPPRYRREPYPPVPAPYYTTNVRNVESSRLPWQRPEYNRSRIHYQDRRSDGSKVDPMKSDRWDDFKKQASIIEEDMAKILEQHERNPEKHSMYPDEWKKFWNRRYKELQAENKDPTKHDFKPEWIDFWNKRMKEMHDADLKQKRDALRKRLNLPEEPSPISFKIGKKKSGSSEPGSTREKEKTIEPDVIVIDDSKDDEPPKDRKRSHSPWEPEPQRDRDRNARDRDQRSQNRDRDRYMPEYSRDYYKPKSYREPPIEREYKRKMTQSPKYSQKEENEEINVVAILRLLCAVEDKLGSLGPKITEMLSRALALEKKEANSSETLLDNEINCVLFETVKEKLKGLLLAELVSINAEKTFKSCIQKIASLLHFANERKKTKDKEQAVKNKEPVKIPGIGAIDKGAIAKQIATALVAQGKTDVTQAELEQLINAVVGMAQASQATGKTISTASFVQQLSSPVLQKTDFSGILKQTMAAAVAAANKPEPVSSALQLLQSTSASMASHTAGFAAAGAMDSLSDAELKTLLQNFKDLSTDEQHSLITYLKKLEAKEPERVERLRKFVKLGPTNMTDPEKAFPATTSGRTSPFSNREAGVNPTLDDIDKRDMIKPLAQNPKVVPENIKIDSDEDEDYSFEDVFRAASKNVNDKQMEDRRLEEAKKSEKAKEQANINLNDAKMLIANLMGQLGKKNNTSINLLGLGTSLSNVTPKPIAAATTTNLLNFPTTSTISTTGAQSQQYTNISNNPINPMNSIQYPIGANQMNPSPVGINSNLIGANQMNPNPAGANQANTNSVGTNQINSNPNSPAQYNYPQNNRQYNTSYDGFHSQNDYHGGNQSLLGNMNYNQAQADQNNSGYGSGNAYNMNTYGQQQMQNTRQAAPQYGRSTPAGQQQYQQYDSRQNYY